VNIEVFADVDSLAIQAAERIAGVLRDAPGERVSLGLAGGSTPASTYRELRALPARWERVDAWLADERWVPHNHSDSNGQMAAGLLLDHVNARFYRPRWAPWLEPAESAAHYEATLRSLHQPDAGPDLVLLGIGTDGHTASLFPGTKALAEGRRWFVANEIPNLDTWRLTCTLLFLRRAQRVVFLVAGPEKADVMARIEAGDEVPAALVANLVSDTTWLLDRAAASKLPA
jgi:6-phosphogluconolactonase